MLSYQLNDSANSGDDYLISNQSSGNKYDCSYINADLGGHGNTFTYLNPNAIRDVGP